MKTVTIPFDLELAKKIQNKEVEGNIVDGEGTEYEIVKWDAKGDYPLIATFFDEEDNSIRVNTFTGQGAYNRRGRTKLDLQLVVPEYLTWKDGDYLTIHYDGYPHIYIFIYKSFKANVSNPIKYHALFISMPRKVVCFKAKDFDTYEEALEEGLKQACKIVKDRRGNE